MVRYVGVEMRHSYGWTVWDRWGEELLEASRLAHRATLAVRP